MLKITQINENRNETIIALNIHFLPICNISKYELTTPIKSEGIVRLPTRYHIYTTEGTRIAINNDTKDVITIPSLV